MNLHGRKGPKEIEINCHMRKIWYRLYRIIMESSDQSCSARKKTTMSSPLSSSTLFFLIAIWVIGDFTVKGAYATSASRSSSDSPYSLPLHGDKMNKHQVRILEIFFINDEFSLHVEWLSYVYL